MVEGQPVKQGERLGKIGDSTVNGGWPPHLHFQIITDMLGRSGEFPGVARPSQREMWLSLSLDPNLILGIPALMPPKTKEVESGGWSIDQILSVRRQHIGPNLSISYRQPLKIVRGYRQYLYNEEGQPYLDAVNNVPHVGHNHPWVVKAGQEQMAVLNTNTRYLHESLVRYAERLTATLPEPLRVCYFVCSGSEANELALRLARTHTSQKDTIVVDVGYHGNTTSLIEISPYKHDGPGGAGAPPYVHNTPMPDVYRGAYQKNDPQAGAKYTQAVATAIERIQASGKNVAAFICESILSCGGQVVLPEGYLREVYRHVRAAGGVCIADEVQVGLGRVGTHFWAFETQGVVPDIVTVGKPIGNGHPLAAVITTPQIAASFNNGMEYFNTFGGNPVSCAIGMAVLDVIEAEGLQAHALKVGRYMLKSLQQLMDRHPIVGDVRGLGLFIGIELVLDRETLEPAGEQASYISNRMRDHGILVSTDGPFHNVLKIKPPLVFNEANADFFVATLDKILHEDFVRVI
ncbi:MAG: aminotransferase class III-fold pyridoxal phosphate-dependent enzyme [Anaerolineae bacterium]